MFVGGVLGFVLDNTIPGGWGGGGVIVLDNTIPGGRGGGGVCFGGWYGKSYTRLF